LLAIALLPAIAAADTFTFSLDSPAQSAIPGETLTFAGLLGFTPDSTGAVDMFLNSDAFANLTGLIPAPSWDPTQVVADDSDFLANAPFCMNPTGTAVDTADCGSPTPASDDFVMFTITVGANVAPGVYTGTFEIQGGADSNADDVLASANFEVDVTGQESGPASTPEPSTFVLFGLGLAAGVRKRFAGQKGSCWFPVGACKDPTVNNAGWSGFGKKP